MGIYKSKLFVYIVKLVDFLLLSVIWAIACIPVITIFPSTAAMFGVVRGWQLENKEDGVFRPFFKLFKENFRQGVGLSIIWTIIGLSLYGNVQLIEPSASIVQTILFVLTVFVAFLYGLLTMYLFPMMAHVQTTWYFLIRNALLLLIANPLYTILLSIVTFGTGYFLLMNPAGLFFITSFFAYFVCFIFLKAFNTLNVYES